MSEAMQTRTETTITKLEALKNKATKTLIEAEIFIEEVKNKLRPEVYITLKEEEKQKIVRNIETYQNAVSLCVDAINFISNNSQEQIRREQSDLIGEITVGASKFNAFLKEISTTVSTLTQIAAGGLTIYKSLSALYSALKGKDATPSSFTPHSANSEQLKTVTATLNNTQL